MDTIQHLLQSVSDFFSWLDWFYHQGVLGEVQRLLAYLLSLWTVFYWSVKVSFLTYSWGIAQQMLIDLNISTYIQAMYSHFDSQTLSTLTWLRVPEFVNTILTAYMTRWVMSLMSGAGGMLAGALNAAI